jgi:hypothetical protein
MAETLMTEAALLTSTPHFDESGRYQYRNFAPVVRARYGFHLKTSVTNLDLIRGNKTPGGLYLPGVRLSVTYVMAECQRYGVWTPDGTGSGTYKSTVPPVPSPPIGGATGPPVPSELTLA